MKLKKKKRMKIAGYFEELEQFNREIEHGAVRMSGKEYVRIFYGNVRSLNKEKEEILRNLSIEEDADIIAFLEAGFFKGEQVELEGF